MMKFCLASCSEISDIKKIARRVIAHNYTAFLGKELVDLYIESGQSDKEIEANVKNCFVAKKGTVILGFVIIKEELLHLIMVDVEFQRKGYGGFLLEFAESAMFKNYSVVSMQSFETNPVAINFYLKNSWLIKDKREIDGVKMLTMEKSSF